MEFGAIVSQMTEKDFDMMSYFQDGGH